MKTIATHERRTFLKDHPPVMQRMLLHSTGVEQDLIAGTVLGEKDGKCGEFTSGAEALGILVEDTTIPARPGMCTLWSTYTPPSLRRSSPGALALPPQNKKPLLRRCAAGHLRK